MGRDIHTRVLRSEKGCRIRVTHVHACSDCVHTRNDTVRLIHASRFVRVILGRSSFSVAPHTRPGGAACTFPGGAARESPGSALFSAKFSPTLATSTWISFRRCHPHAPPFPCSSPCISDSASRTCSDGVSHTRPDVASSASVTVHSIASIVEPGLGGGSTLALLRTLSQAEFTSHACTSRASLARPVRLTEDRSCSSSFPHSASLLLPSLLAVLSVTTASHEHVAAVLPGNMSDLSR